MSNLKLLAIFASTIFVDQDNIVVDQFNLPILQLRKNVYYPWLDPYKVSVCTVYFDIYELDFVSNLPEPRYYH